MNKRPIRHDFWNGTIWNRSRVNIAFTKANHDLVVRDGYRHLSSDWFILLFMCVVISQSKSFGFGFTTLKWKPL